MLTARSTKPAAFACKEAFAKAGQRITTVASMLFGTPATKMLRIASIGAEQAAG